MLLTDPRIKIINTLAKQPSEALKLSDIAVRARISLETAHRQLNSLNKKNYLLKESTGKTRSFSLNLENDEVKKILEYLLVKKRDRHLDDNLRKFSKELLEYIEPIRFLTVFDKHVLVVTYGKPSSGYNASLKAMAKLYGLNCFISSLEDFKAHCQENKDFARSAWQNSIVLHGVEEFVRHNIGFM